MLAAGPKTLCAACKGEPLCMQTCGACRGAGWQLDCGPRGACADWPWCTHGPAPVAFAPPSIIVMPCGCARRNVADPNCGKCGGLGRRAYLTSGASANAGTGASTGASASAGSYLHNCVSGPTRGCLCEQTVLAGGHTEYPHVTILAGCKCGIVAGVRSVARCRCGGEPQLNVLCEVDPATAEAALRNMVLRPPARVPARPYTA